MNAAHCLEEEDKQHFLRVSQDKEHSEGLRELERWRQILRVKTREVLFFPRLEVTHFNLNEGLL